MSKASNYYYEQLNKEQQKAYYAMKEGLLNQQDSFAVPMLDKFYGAYGLPGNFLFRAFFVPVLSGFYGS